MERAKLPSSIRRWWWVLVSVVMVTGGAAGLHVLSTSAPYQARVTLQLTAPRDVDVSVLDSTNPSTSTLRDDLTLVQSDLMFVVASAEAKMRTQHELQLEGNDASYIVSLSPVADSHFMILMVTSSSPDLARRIADAHAAQAIRLLGELRARPATDTERLLATQLQAARDRLPAATPSTNGPVASADAQDAQFTYASLLRKYAQASIAAENAARASFVQITDQAAALARPSLIKRMISLLVPSLVGACGLGVLLMLGLERGFPRRRPEQPLPAANAEIAAPSQARQALLAHLWLPPGEQSERPCASASAGLHQRQNQQ